MEKCPKCKRYTLERTKVNEKRCLKDGCTIRVYDDGSTSDLVLVFGFKTNTIKRVRTYPDGRKETINEHCFLGEI